MDRPDIDSRGPLRLPGDERNIGLARIKTAVDEPAPAFVRQRQHREKSLAPGSGDIEMIFLRDRPERVRIMIGDRLEHLVRSQAGDVLPGLVHQGRDTRRVDGENDDPLRQLQSGHPVE